jgi:glutamate racemase
VTSDESEETKRLAASISTRYLSPVTRQQLPIGVFDSGVGGLTVLQALRDRLPRERFIYLGDTARLPYGTKSAESIVRYSTQAASFLVGCGIKYLVVACNTASSVALEELRGRFEPLPVVGVIEPGAQAACDSSRSGHIAVIATEGTVRGGAYQNAIAAKLPNAVLASRACSLFVALAEEGWTQGEIAEATARRYLSDLIAADSQIDTLLLGCTHFPVLRDTLQRVVGERICIVDSAHTTAAFLDRDLSARGLHASEAQSGSVRFLATDSGERFARVGSLFLGESVAAEEVELVDLGLNARA